MRARIQANFKYIKKNILSVNNVMHLDIGALLEFQKNKPELVSKVEFTRALVAATLDLNNGAKCLPKETLGDKEMKMLLYYLLIGILTDIYKVGRCHELACVGFSRFLKQGFSDSIEVVSYDGISINGQEGDHVLLILNRDSKSEIHNVPSWKSFIKFDTWADTEPKSIVLDKTLNNDVLGGGLMYKITNIKSEIRYDTNLTKNMCEIIVSFLRRVKKLYTEKMLAEACKKAGRKLYDVKKELEVIKERIDKEIACFEHLIKHPPVSPESFAVLLYKNPPSYDPRHFFPKENKETTEAPKKTQGKQL